MGSTVVEAAPMHEAMEEALIQTLQIRYNKSENFSYTGPVLLFVNPFGGSCEWLLTPSCDPEPSPLGEVAERVLDDAAQSGKSQTLVLNGDSGSGKSHASLLLLREIFTIAGEKLSNLRFSLCLLLSRNCARETDLLCFIGLVFLSYFELS